MPTTINLEQENMEISKRYKDMLRNSYQNLTTEDKKLIRKAFDVAKDAHKDQRRKSGEPYIYHPLEVARIVADEIGLGATSIAAALLHDVVEDTHYTLEDIDNLFGPKIAKIINGLTKISIIDHQDISIQSENYRKLLLTLSEDIRVILIKIADRLHNMRTLESMKPDKQKKIASETTYIYAPLAHRMGLYAIKSELEDLSLKYTHPEIYDEIEKKLVETEKQRAKYIKEFNHEIAEKLEDEGLSFKIKGRPKSIYSIYKKMVKQNVSIDEIYDIFAIRVIYNSDKANEKFLAWKIYSVVTDKYQPNPSRMRDWISQPRSTGYESLHATVVGPEGKWIEVQIRSHRMDEIAEKGIAAHYKYKDGFRIEDNQIENWITQIREVLEQQQDVNAAEFMDNLKLNLYAKEIFVFTPKGELKVLPNGATALDFAYDIHTNVGDTCLGAKVNGKLVPLSHTLISGDQIEIITSANQKPKQDWLDFVTTARAKSKIKSSLNAERRKLAIDGKEILIRKLRHLKIAFNDKEINNMQKFFNSNSSQDLYYDIASGKVDSKEIKRYVDSKSVFNAIINRFKKSREIGKRLITKEKEETQKSDKTYLDLLVFGDNDEKLGYKLATCCNPISGDKVFGFLTINEGVKVHKDDCPNAINLRANYDYRVLSAKWIDSSMQEFLVSVELIGIDRLGMVNDITKVISENLNINMKTLNFSSEDGIFEGKITIEVKNKGQLEKIMDRLKKIEGMSKIRRTYI